MEPDPFKERFREGLNRVKEGNYREALRLFHDLLEVSKEEGNDRTTVVRYQSYYALCMTMVYGPSREAIQLCERAVSKEFYNPDLYCNLGSVYLRCRKKGAAFRAFQRGLVLRPDHPRLLEAMNHFGQRRRPIFPFLSRHHFLNRFLGRLRHQIRAGSDLSA